MNNALTRSIFTEYQRVSMCNRLKLFCYNHNAIYEEDTSSLAFLSVKIEGF